VSRTQPVFAAHVEGPPELIFDLIADMPNYGRWLPGSNAFGGTTQVTPYPVQLGSTYLDAGPAGKRPGLVTEFARPRHIGFHHTMLIRRWPIRADIEVDIRYTFEPVEGGTSVVRALDLRIEMPAWIRWAEPFVLRAFRKENERIMMELKRSVEAQPREQSGAAG
jgi:hypothetical protein